MPLAKNRELIPVSGEAHAHLKNVVDAMKRKGIPATGTMLASQVILAIPIPEVPQPQPKRRKAQPSTPVRTSAA